MPTNSFFQLAHETIAATSIPQRLQVAGAVVLERIARGAGETCWYYCHDEKILEFVEARLRPGSMVSFYFDDRIKHGPYSVDIKDALKNLILETGEVLVGTLQSDGAEINAHVLYGAEEIEDEEPDFLSSRAVFYGVFPGRDDDGLNAITVTLPDSDGVTRAHPY